MNKNTLKLTTGAMCTAIFGVLLFLNRQTGSLFQEIFIYIFPIPMTIFSVQYGLKSSLPVLAAMTLLSAFLGSTPMIIFYSLTETLIGLVLGSLIFAKKDPTRTLFLVMGLSAFIMVVDTVFLASLFGNDMDQILAEMKEMMDKALSTAGIVGMENLINSDYLKKIFMISMIFSGGLQGFIIFQLTLLILRKLRFHITPAKPLFELFPPKWTGILAALLFFAYNGILSYQNAAADPAVAGNLDPGMLALLAQNPYKIFDLIQILGILGQMYLMIFGTIGVVLYVKPMLSRSKILPVMIGFICYLMLPPLVLVMGFCYVSTNHHQTSLDRWYAVKAQIPKVNR